MAFWRPFEDQIVENNNEQLNDAENINVSAELDIISENDDESDSDSESASDGSVSDNQNIQIEKRKHLSKSSQQIILNMYKQLVNEKNGKSYGVIKRICELTSVNRKTVYRIVTRGCTQLRKKRVSKPLRNMSVELKMTIKNLVYDFYSENQIPTLEDI